MGLLAKMGESFRKYGKGIAAMLCASVFACLGQLLWKISGGSDILLMLAGFALYGIGAVLMLWAYRFGPVSVLQPMLSANYILSLILGALVLGESVGAVQVLGVVVITAGIVLIAGGDE